MKLKIPKILHFVWIGNPISDKYLQHIQKWAIENPDYTIYLWIDSAATTPEQINEAVRKAQLLPDVHLCDINNNHRTLLEHAPTKRYYQDEVTGHSANLGAGCDLLRLEILASKGGIYIDADIPPVEGNPLGTLEVDNDMGVLLLPGTPNDVIAAIPNSKFINEVRNRAIQYYQELYFSSLDKEESMDLHRSKRPWKQRFETTYAWSGPDLYRTVFNEHFFIRDSINRNQWGQQIISADFAHKFQMESDQNWRDKGPKNLQEKNSYFKEEMRFRLMHQLLVELEKIIVCLSTTSEPDSTIHALKELHHRFEKLGEVVPSKDIFNSWHARFPKTPLFEEVITLINLGAALQEVLNQNSFSEETINTLKNNLFPKERYNVGEAGIQLNKKFRDNMLLQQVYTKCCELIKESSSSLTALGLFSVKASSALANACDTIKAAGIARQTPFKIHLR